MPLLDAAYFDEWYEASIASPHDDAIARLLLLPAGVSTNSSLCGPGFDEVVFRLEVAEGHLVVDLGCGRGQLGVELRRRTQCRIVGVDFSEVAVHAAELHARTRGQTSPDVVFGVGDLAATGLPDGCADAVMSIDALFFASPMSAGVAECRRILRPGGRFVATGWEPADSSASRRPPVEEVLVDHGFRDVLVEERPAWYEIERHRWLAVAAMSDDGDPMLHSAQREAESLLARWDDRRRVLVTAVNTTPPSRA